MPRQSSISADRICSRTDLSLSRCGRLLGGRAPRMFRFALPCVALRSLVAHEGEHRPKRGERKEGSPGASAMPNINNAATSRARGYLTSWFSTAVSVAPRVPPFETSNAAESEMISAGICDTRPSPTDSFGIDVRGLPEWHVVAGRANDDSAENIHCQNDQPGDGVASHEFGGAVHRAEKRAFFLEFAAATLRLLVVDQAGREVGVDRHLLAGNRVRA